MGSSDFLSEEDLDQKLPEWMEQVEEFSDRFREFKLEESALLVVDMQNDFLTEDGHIPVWGGPAIIPRLKEVVGAFREAGRPVLFTRHSYRNAEVDGGATGEWWGLDQDSPVLKEGLPNAEIHPDLAPRDDEPVITKQRYDAFFNTNLDALLDGMDVSQVVIGGVASNCCGEATAHGALFRNFHVLFLADGTGGTDEQSHISVLRDIAWGYGTIMTCDDVLTRME